MSADLMMPHASGFDLVEAMRQDEKLAAIPIIIVTAEPSRDNVKRALELDVNGFVSKPFDARALTEKVRQVLRQSGIRLES